MSDNRKKIKSNLKHSMTTKNLVVSVEQLLDDCKKFNLDFDNISHQIEKNIFLGNKNKIIKIK